ncbi:MAG: hypothetical protein WCY19_01755 [Candidatus Gastranaerophilaceae bacterium]
MAIDAVQNNNSGRISVLGSAVFGGLAGYSLKWALPVTSQEKKGDYFESKTEEIRTNVRAAKSKAIGGIKDLPVKDEAAENLLSLLDGINFRYTALKAKNLPEESVHKIMELKAGVDYEARKVLIVGIEERTAYLKKMRPTNPFVLIGACIALMFALLHNAINQNSPEEA